MGIALDGLVSGLNTTELIDALMDVHAIPRQLLRAKVDDKGLVVKELQSLNTALQQLSTAAEKAASGKTTAQLSATSSSTAVTLQIREGAAAVSADIVVDRLAQKHTVVTAAASAWPDDPPVLTLRNAAGETLEISAASTSLDAVARAINDAGFGVTASVVSSGVDAQGAPLQRLQLVAAEPGAASTFEVLRGSAADLAAGTAVDVATEPGAAVISTGADAQVRLWAGTAAEQVITSSQNTFTDLFAGVDVTVAAASTAPVTLAVTSDDAASTKAAADFVKQLAAILTGIDKGSKATVSTTGDANATLGVFTGDSTVRALRQSLAQAVQHPIDGVSPSSIGISIDRYGALSIDEKKFAAALADDPAQVQALFTGIAGRVQQTADTYSDKYDGLLTTRITGQEKEIKSLGTQIESWDTRLAQRRATLERTYARLESMLSQLESQSNYLTSQLSSLSGLNSGSK